TASVVTGRGVQELQGSFDTAIAAGQTVLGEALRRVTELAFELDERLWPADLKVIDGTIAGETFHDTYRPDRDIAGNYACTVSYGFAAGQSPAQAIVMMLQLLAAAVADLAPVRLNLPFPIDTAAMQQQLDVQKTRQAAIAGLASALAATGQMAAAGGDPSTLLRAAGEFIRGRTAGRAVEDLLTD